MNTLTYTYIYTYTQTHFFFLCTGATAAARRWTERETSSTREREDCYGSTQVLSDSFFHVLTHKRGVCTLFLVLSSFFLRFLSPLRNPFVSQIDCATIVLIGGVCALKPKYSRCRIWPIKILTLTPLFQPSILTRWLSPNMHNKHCTSELSLATHTHSCILYSLAVSTRNLLDVGNKASPKFKNVCVCTYCGLHFCNAPCLIYYGGCVCNHLSSHLCRDAEKEIQDVSLFVVFLQQCIEEEQEVVVSVCRLSVRWWLLLLLLSKVV